MHLARKLRTAGTLETYESALGTVFALADESGWPSDPRKWEPFLIEEYRQAYQTYAPGTMLHHLTVLLMYLDWVGNVICRDVELHITPTPLHVGWLKKQEAARILATAPRLNVHATEVLMLFCGLRLGEVHQLRTQDMTDMWMRVRGKGDKERRMPLDVDFWKEMEEYLAWRSSYRTRSDHLILTTPRGRWKTVPELVRPSYGTIQDWVVDHGSSVGLHISPHWLRRTYGRDMFFGGCPLVKVSKLMGHATLEMTIRYLGLQDADLEDTAQFRPKYREMYLPELSQLR